MDLRRSVLAELKRRAALLPEELDSWRTRIASREVVGIYSSQFEAIAILFDYHHDLQKGLLAQLAAAIEADDLNEFTGLRSELEADLAGSHALMEIFRELLYQRDSTSRVRDELDLADLVAEACYDMAISHAQDWGVVGPDFRVLSLCWLNPLSYPGAIRAGLSLGVFGRELGDGLQRLHKLTVPILSLRFHDTGAIWSFCSIYHEAGHLVDSDLDLRSELVKVVGKAITDDERAKLWRKWTPEMLADVLSVLWGGAGYAYTLVDLLFAEPMIVGSIEPDDPHPAPTIRVALLAALLRQTEVPALAKAADKIWSAWEECYYADDPKPEELMGYIEDCPAVAEVLIDGMLFEQLKNHSLRDLGDDLEEDHAYAVALSQFLQGKGVEPDKDLYPIRMVPAAARLALLAAAEDAEGEDLDEVARAIHCGALAFARSLPRPVFMADPYTLTYERKEYLKKVAAQGRFGRRYTDDE
jgi:hypothetical protein